EEGRLTAQLDGETLFIRYGWARDGVMRVDHVEVPAALGGRGLGTALVGALVEKARAEGFKLLPVCGFARHQLQKHADWQDVLA
ncbi:MAG: GNAT family N-acetyltransferase, partial [Pseudomonadota bacterium]